MKTFKILVLAFFILGPAFAWSQDALPINEETGLITLEGSRKVDEKSKKKILEGMNSWVGKKLDYPPMVFSIISSDKSRIEVKALTELPSSKGLHPVSFRLVLIPGKRKFDFVANQFYFEDINLSLEQWYEKYGESTNERHNRNNELITTGLESHIFMSMNNLAELFVIK